MEWIGVAAALFLLWGLPAWDARQKRKSEERIRRQRIEMDVAITAAAHGRAGLMLKLAADLRAVRARRIVVDGIDEGRHVRDILREMEIR